MNGHRCTTLSGDAVLRVTRAAVDLTLEVAMKRGDPGYRLLAGVHREPLYMECASAGVLAKALANILHRGDVSPATRAAAALRAFVDGHPEEWATALIDEGDGPWTRVWVPVDPVVQAAAQLADGQSWLRLGIVRRDTGGCVLADPPHRLARCLAFWNAGDPVEQVRTRGALAALAPAVADVDDLHLMMTDILRRIR